MHIFLLFFDWLFSIVFDNVIVVFNFSALHLLYMLQLFNVLTLLVPEQKILQIVIESLLEVGPSDE